MKKLDEFRNVLQRLKKEKSDRLCKVEDLKEEIHLLALAKETKVRYEKFLFKVVDLIDCCSGNLPDALKMDNVDPTLVLH
ncbi:hypothetical protein FCM35_KLT03286 [Carex littledalei]|uniref:Uncharacterized protein n=1 Tax=Carex littledalei TaxID=544730 RepID=A0A833QR97_9POAL|nr:hypothetical protein FCM35_KLT03286 [Carex littledalei]